MKKLVTLLAAAGMVVAASAPASAADIKLGGFHAITFERDALGFDGTNESEALQRTRLNLSIAASENLKGFIEFQMGTNSWGDYGYAGYGNNVKHGRYDVQTRQAYIDWTVPGTAVKVRMGRSCFGLPAEAFGNNSAMDSGWGGRDGIIVTAPVADWLNVTALWSRAFSDKAADTDQENNADIFGVAAALKFNGFAVTPYAAYASIDDGATGKAVDGVTNGLAMKGNANAYWVGATATLTAFDPFTLKVSGVYGSMEYEGNGLDDKDGWNVQAKASYKLGFGTAVLGAWYGSGDDKNEADYNSKGVIRGGNGWMPSINGRFLAAQNYHDNSWGLSGGVCNDAINGTWGVQTGIEGVSFLQDLSHDVKVTYIGGTNDKSYADEATAKYLTEDDAAIEFALSNTYKIYKNLAANLELSYIIGDFENKALDEDDWTVGLHFKYTF